MARHGIRTTHHPLDGLHEDRAVVSRGKTRGGMLNRGHFHYDWRVRGKHPFGKRGIGGTNAGEYRAMNKEEILAQVASGELAVDEAAKLLSDLEPAKRGALYCKVSQKGGMSLYGLQRMPVTLYAEQWERLLDFAENLRTFLEEHRAELKRKGQ